MSVSNVTGGIEVKIVCDGGGVEYQRSYPGPFLSPLNTNEIWVETLTTAEHGAARYALFLPLERQIGVLDVRYTAPEWTTDFSTLELGVADGSCQTLFIQRVLYALYAVCVFQPANSGASSTRLYEIILNVSRLGESSASFQSFGTYDGYQFTNLVYAKLSRTDRFFFFVRDGMMTRIRPEDHFMSSTHLDFDADCNFTSIQYVPSTNRLLAHLSCCSEQQEPCSRYGTYYSTYSGELPQSSDGLPYHCPDFDKRVIVQESSGNFSFQEASYQLEGSGFIDGLCSGVPTSLWFAYQDRTGQIFAVDLSLSPPTPHRVSENGCLLGPSCRSVSNISDILVIQEFDEDTQQFLAKGIRPYANYDTVFEVWNMQPSFFALLNVPPPPDILPSTTVTYGHIASSHSHVTSLESSITHSQLPTNSPTQPTSMNTESNKVVSVVVPVVAIPFVIIIIIVVVVCILCKCQIKGKHPLTEDAGDTEIPCNRIEEPQQRRSPSPGVHSEGAPDPSISSTSSSNTEVNGKHPQPGDNTRPLQSSHHHPLPQCPSAGEVMPSGPSAGEVMPSGNPGQLETARSGQPQAEPAQRARDTPCSSTTAGTADPHPPGPGDFGSDDMLVIPQPQSDDTGNTERVVGLPLYQQEQQQQQQQAAHNRRQNHDRDPMTGVL